MAFTPGLASPCVPVFTGLTTTTTAFLLYTVFFHHTFLFRAENTFLSGSMFATCGTGLLHATAEEPPIVNFMEAETQLYQIALATKILAPKLRGLKQKSLVCAHTPVSCLGDNGAGVVQLGLARVQVRPTSLSLSLDPMFFSWQ